MNDLRRLPLLEAHKDTLERCVYCPKLCRATCPVSNAEPSETLTPWGKMSNAYFLARGDVTEDAVHAAPAWACTSCHACTGRCDHQNDVARVLGDERAELFAHGVAPKGARQIADRFEGDVVDLHAKARALGASSSAEITLLVGCGYLLHAPREAELAVKIISTLASAPVRVAESCCGLPLLNAGDRAGFMRAARALRDDIAGQRVVVVDPGCAQALFTTYPRHGIDVGSPRLFIDVVANAIADLRPIEGAKPPRYHDPCQLGRGLGRYDEPRNILAKLTGEPPLEFDRKGREADCSGGGGGLPQTMPEVSRAISDARIAQHRSAGEARLVTHCASSLRRFRASGEPADDLIGWIARGLGLDAGANPG